MTKAEEFRSKRKADYASPAEFFNLILSIDPNAYAESSDLGPVIHFTDGSIHRMDRK